MQPFDGAASPDYRWIEERLWKLLEDYQNGKLKTEENCEVTDEESI